MPPPAAQRAIQCYHCRRQFEISARAMTVSCPGCARQLRVEDIVITNTQSYSRLQTCGRILVKPKGRIIADLVEAHDGIDVRGVMEAKAVRSGPVVIGAKAKWKGDCRASSLTIELGAVVSGGYFVIPDDGAATQNGSAVTVQGEQPAAHAAAAAEPKPPPKPAAKRPTAPSRSRT